MNKLYSSTRSKIVDFFFGFVSLYIFVFFVGTLLILLSLPFSHDVAYTLSERLSIGASFGLVLAHILGIVYFWKRLKYLALGMLFGTLSYGFLFFKSLF